MHALLLSLVLGQAGPVAPAPPEGAPPEAAPPEDGPWELLAPPEAIRPQPPGPGVPASRAVDFTRLPDGGFRATLDGVPVAGEAFYRAVLRPDLAARAEEARGDRNALLIAAAAAPLLGLGMGWVYGTAHQWPLPACVGEPPGPVNCAAHDQVAAQNKAAMNTGLLAGAIGGLASGLVLWVAGASIHPLEPSADEAEALVRAYRARRAPATPSQQPSPQPSPPAAAAPVGATLRLEAGPRAVGLALRIGF